MNGLKHMRNCLLVCSLVAILQPLPGLAQHNSSPSRASLQQDRTEHDGQHDFDFEIGTWQTHLKRLVHPLTGSTTWVEYEGTTVVQKVWNGRANLVELEVDGPAGHVEGLSLRLYNPQSRQWSLNFSTRKLSMVEPSLFDSLFRTSRRIRAVLNRPFQTTEARLGKSTGSRQT